MLSDVKYIIDYISGKVWYQLLPFYNILLDLVLSYTSKIQVLPVVLGRVKSRSIEFPRCFKIEKYLSGDGVYTLIEHNINTTIQV